MLNINQSLLDSICKDEQIVFLGLFGSQARNEAHHLSDVDLLVDFNQTKSFFELARIQEKLENAFHKKVDLTTKNSIKPALKASIFKDLVTLYGKK